MSQLRWRCPKQCRGPEVKEENYTFFGTNVYEHYSEYYANGEYMKKVDEDYLEGPYDIMCAACNVPAIPADQPLHPGRRHG